MASTDSPTLRIRQSSWLWPVAVLLLSIAWQLHCALHGLDLTDEGYLMSVYQWFGTDITAAKGAGGYPLTCWLGWFVAHYLPGNGLLAMRLWGVALVTLTEVIAYLWLRRWFSSRLLLVGLFIQLVFVSGDPKPLGYNTLTGLFYLLALIATIEGLTRNRYLLLFVGGMFVGVNIWIRLPNIIGLCLLLIPLCWRFLKPDYGVKRAVNDSLWMLYGLAVSFITVMLLILQTGVGEQLEEFLLSISGQLGGNSSHASGTMFLTYLKNYGEALLYLVIFLATIAAFSFGNQLIRSPRKTWHRPCGVLLFLMAVITLIGLLYIQSDVLGHRILSTMNGIALAGCIILLTEKSQPILKGIALAAILMALLCPLGSDRGFVTMWVGTWLALPVGFCGLSKKVPANGLRPAVLVLLLIVILKIEVKAYYDPEPKYLKTSAIDSPQANNIYTSERKARVLNPLLKELRQYVKPGDTMLIYDDSPMLYYLTQTKPFGGISWPGVFVGQRYIQVFQKTLADKPQLPVVVLQYFSTSGAWTAVDNSRYDTSKETNPDLRAMKEMLNGFLNLHGYHPIWSNGYYTIFLPVSE